MKLYYLQVKLEFYERKKGRWLLPAEVSNWEVWSVQLDLTHPRSDDGVCVCVCVCVCGCVCVLWFTLYTDWEQHQQGLVEALSETVSINYNYPIHYTTTHIAIKNLILPLI